MFWLRCFHEIEWSSILEHCIHVHLYTVGQHILLLLVVWCLHFPQFHNANSVCTSKTSSVRHTKNRLWCPDKLLPFFEFQKCPTRDLVRLLSVCGPKLWNTSPWIFRQQRHFELVIWFLHQVQLQLLSLLMSCYIVIFIWSCSLAHSFSWRPWKSNLQPTIHKVSF